MICLGSSTAPNQHDHENDWNRDAKEPQQNSPFCAPLLPLASADYHFHGRNGLAVAGLMQPPLIGLFLDLFAGLFDVLAKPLRGMATGGENHQHRGDDRGKNKGVIARMRFHGRTC